MLELPLILLLLAENPTPRDTTTAPPSGARDTSRVVREFPPVLVRALLHDLRSSQTVHVLPGAVLRSLPVDGLVDALALMPGVVVHGEELHVRGGRSGETVISLDGLTLNEPFRRRPIEVPLFAVRSAELVSGAPEAQYGGGLAGVVALRTVDPGPRPSVEWRWQTDGRLGTHYDRAGARAGVPLGLFGLGLVAAGDATLDDTWHPSLRGESRRRVLGTSWGWRSENRLLGFAKLAPVSGPQPFSAQVLVNRLVHRPYSPSWTQDGWVFVPANLKVSPTYSPVPQPGYLRYRAADHLAITDDRQLAAWIELSSLGTKRRVTSSVGWLRTRTVTSLDGRREPITAVHRPRYGSALDRDLFEVLWGDDPIYRESEADVFSLRSDGEIVARTGSFKAGVGLTHEAVSMREMEWMPFAARAGDEGYPFPLDSIRAYRARAPGGHAYVQGRWLSGGMVMHTGLRAEYFTPGSAADRQTLPGSDRGVWSLAPRLGIAYPISVRDAFSLAYVRIHQAPGRDFLYDQRKVITDRQPLGNPALGPATLISYQAAVKHLFGPTLALQASVFYRDVFHQVGAVDEHIPEGPINLRYLDADEGHAHGFELSLIGSRGEVDRFEAHYVWMSAWGNESRPEGDPYGPVRVARAQAIGDQPLAWDRRHSFLLSGAYRSRESVSLSWSTAVGSPLPWTPKPRRQPFTDWALANSRRLDWSENTNASLEWAPARLHGLRFGLEARNLFDHRSERFATVDGYPNPVINTRFDDYGAYRTETGLGGGAYWSMLEDRWVPVHDPRLSNPPRAVRASIGARW